MKQRSKVSVIISNRNDTVMLAVTVRSALEALKAIDAPGNVIIADNSDQHIYDLLDSFIPIKYSMEGKVKILRQPFPCLFTARELAASHSDADYILCVDGHVLFGHHMIKDLVSFMDFKVNDPTVAFAHAPISWAHQHESRAKHDRDMTSNELGPWGKAYNSCRTITWKGMPWICRREWFLDKDKGLNGYGALSQHTISWGGGDMHIGVKPWLLGFKNWAVPTSPAIHIGPFPKLDTVKGDKNSTQVSTDPYRYRLWATSGNYPHSIGFLVSCYILGGESMMERNKATIVSRFGRYIDVDKWWDTAKQLGQEEKTWLDERKVMSFEELLKTAPWNAVSSKINER
jgi:hypothetical protein